MKTSQYVKSSNRIRELTISQTAGISAKIDRIIVCRKPILAVGDSFVCTSSGIQLLARVKGRNWIRKGFLPKEDIVLTAAVAEIIYFMAEAEP